MLLPIPLLCFVGALVTDLAYLRSGGNFLWLNFSSWLIAAGLLFGALALVVAAVAAVRQRRGYGALGLLTAAWMVELLSALIHTRDGWTAVAGTGLILSLIGAVLILASGWLWHFIRSDRERAR